jgi:hypothetical protein
MKGWIAAVCLVAGCASDGGTGPGGNSCGFAVTLSGAVTASFTMSDTLTCATANDLGGNPIIVFYPQHEMLMRFDLDFPAEAAGMTGPVADGHFAVITKSGFVWDGDCAYDVTAWDGVGGQQRLSGTGTCGPLDPESGSATVMTASLAFDMF